MRIANSVAPMFREGARMAGWLGVMLARWIANHLPLKVVYFAVVRAWANATVGQWSYKDATRVTADELCKRLEIE